MERRKQVIAAWALMGALLLASMPLPAKERKGAQVVVERNDGTRVSGELLLVKRESLVVGIRGGGEIVPLGEVRSVRIKKRSKAGTGLLLGLVGGSVIGYALARQSPGCQDPEMTFFLSVAFLGLPAGGLGTLVGLAMGKDSIVATGAMKTDEFLSRLNRHARAPDAALSSGQ